MEELRIRSSSRLPPYAPAVTEDLLSGGRLLLQAFHEAPLCTAPRGTVVISTDDHDPPLMFVHSGSAYACCTLPDGRRAITELFLPRDIAGLEHIVIGSPYREVVAAAALGYRMLPGHILRSLMAEPGVALKMLSLAAEAHRRMDRHLAGIERLDARERTGGLLLDLYDRLRRNDLVSRPTFNIHLTQDEIGDYLGLTSVHISRTLRQLREERIALVDRQVAIIMDLPRLREMVVGLPPLFWLTELVPDAARRVSPPSSRVDPDKPPEAKTFR
jgi:CRP-like cAMP-binding protein